MAKRTKSARDKALEKIYRQNNAEELREYYRNYRHQNREKISNNRKAYYLQNRDRELAQNRLYVRANRPIVNLKKSEWRKNRSKESPEFRAVLALRKRVRRSAAGRTKAGSVIKDLGCTSGEYRCYLESLFVSGMSWDNYGVSWHIDHVVPLSWFDLSNREQFLSACHFSNTQPMWARDNLSKGGRRCV